MALPQDSYAPYTGIDGSTSFTPINDQAEPDKPNDLTDSPSNAATPENTESSAFDKFIPGWKGNGKGVTANESKPDTSSSNNFENSTFDDTSNNGEYDKYTHGWEVKSKEVMKEPSDTEQKQGNLQKKDFLIFAETSGIPKEAANKMILFLLSKKRRLLSLCAESLLPDDMKEIFAELMERRCAVLED